MRKSKTQGFSLVEVVLALGVVAFAFVAILGLIPAGMSTFRQSINISVCSQIGQKVIGDAFQADYDTLMTPPGVTVNPPSSDSSSPFLMAYRFFDEEGNEIPSSSNTSYAPPPGYNEGFIYLVITRVVPNIILPGASTTAVPQNPPLTATLTVQVVFDPSHHVPTPGSSEFYSSSNGPTTESVLLLNPQYVAPPGSAYIPPANVFTYYAHITRS